MPSYYTPQFVAGMKNLTIDGEEFHHIVHVFRKQQNEVLTLINGRGLNVIAVIESIGKKSLIVKTISSHLKEKSLPQIAVGFSLLRGKNDYFIVEKLTELGVSEFYPFRGQYSVRAAGENTVDRFTKTAITAIKQCDNPYLPQIKKVQNLEETLLTLQNDSYTVFAALERDANLLISECFSKPIPNKIALLFGPEGGFSDEEIALFKEKEVVSFSLGNHILRAETAAIAGVSQLLLTILQNHPEYF